MYHVLKEDNKTDSVVFMWLKRYKMIEEHYINKEASV